MKNWIELSNWKFRVDLEIIFKLDGLGVDLEMISHWTCLGRYGEDYHTGYLEVYQARIITLDIWFRSGEYYQTGHLV